MSSDGAGSLLLRELEQRTGIIGSLTGCFTDYRDPKRIEHSLEELLRQRIGALALGYQDLNDHDRLRYDPALALMTGKDDVEGLDRSRERDKGKAMAAHSTLNRFVVTNLGEDIFDARSLYEDFYCGRGNMENRIKEQQQDMFADRTSTHAMASNQLQLWLSAFT